MVAHTTNYNFNLPAVADPIDEDLWGGYLNSNWTNLDSIIFVLLPPGIQVPYGGTAAPTGWLLCDGSAVSRSTYSALFTAIGTAYGVGDGSTTFNVPDKRGRASVGKDNMGGTPANRITAAWADSIGGTGGEESHTMTETEMVTHVHSGSSLSTNSAGSHTHNIRVGSSGSGNISITASGINPAQRTPDINVAAADTSGSHTHTISGNTGSAGSGTPFNIIQPSQADNWIIKW